VTDSTRDKITDYARSAVSRTIFEAVRDAGGPIVDRLISDRHPDWGTTRDVTPADGLMAAQAIVGSARRELNGYIRQAREHGISWRKIGDLLGLADDAKAQDVSAADLAFDLAAGPRNDCSWSERYMLWRCRDCAELINDYGPEAYPEPGRNSHAPGCKRLAVERRAYTAYERQRSQ